MQDSGNNSRIVAKVSDAEKIEYFNFQATIFYSFGLIFHLLFFGEVIKLCDGYLTNFSILKIFYMLKWSRPGVDATKNISNNLYPLKIKAWSRRLFFFINHVFGSKKIVRIIFQYVFFYRVPVRFFLKSYLFT